MLSVPGICSSGMRCRNLKIAVVVAKEPMPRVSKKLVTNPVSTSRMPGRSLSSQRQIKKSASTTSTPRRMKLGRSGAFTYSRRVSIGVGIIAEIWRQPTLGFIQVNALADRVVLDLVEIDLAHREIVRVGVRKVEAADGRRRIHRKGFGETYTGVALHIEQPPERALFRVLGASRVSGRGAYATVFLADQLLVVELLGRGVTPELASHALVQPLGEGFRQPIRERLEQDRVVVIVRSLEARDMRLDAKPRGDRETADVVGDTARLGGDEVGETAVRLALRLALLLTQEMHARDHARA